MIDPYMIASGVASVAAVVGWGKVKSAHGKYKLLEAINKGVRLCNDDLRDLIDNLEVDLAIAKAELRSAKADSHSAWCRKGKIASDAKKAKARDAAKALTIASLKADLLAPMDVAA